ncbi:hypothetical protein JCM13304A_21920 [Desulfothermus okinawensis JCM 13304]
MLYPKVIIKKISSDPENIINIKRGEIAHFIISKIKSIEDIDNLYNITLKSISYFGEKIERWNIDEDFIRPIKDILCTDKLSTIMFNENSKDWSERDILIPKGNNFKLIRPDRIKIQNKKIYILEFKSEYSKDMYKQHLTQIREYMYVFKKMFNRPIIGVLVYIFSNKIMEERLCHV